MPVFVRHCPAGMLELIVITRPGQSSVHNLLILTPVIPAKAGIQDFLDPDLEPRFCFLSASH
jgi:hypothetical protein